MSAARCATLAVASRVVALQRQCCDDCTRSSCRPCRMIFEGLPEGIASMRRDRGTELMMFGERILTARHQRRLIEVRCRVLLRREQCRACASLSLPPSAHAHRHSLRCVRAVPRSRCRRRPRSSCLLAVARRRSWCPRARRSSASASMTRCCRTCTTRRWWASDPSRCDPARSSTPPSRLHVRRAL